MNHAGVPLSQVTASVSVEALAVKDVVELAPMMAAVGNVGNAVASVILCSW